MLSSRESDFFLADWRIRPQLNVLESPEGREFAVEPRSMEVLLRLAAHGGEVVRKERLIGAVWGEAFVSDDALTHAIWELRKTLGDDSKEPRFIQTVPRRGYRLVARVNRLDTPASGEERLVGRYRVGEKLGGGAMGVVHRAEDTRLGRQVALKFLAPELVRDPEAQARFLREARAASSLDNPSICTVHDIGEDEDGGIYLAMAYYEGETLKRRLSRGPLPPEEALEVAAQIAEGLAAAHAKGIVHRDLKPANVMLTSEGRAKLLDFGLAKLADASMLTGAGHRVGTPAYMAPEQARGEAIDHRVDLWALGVVLYQMLTGRLPFAGEDSNAVLYAIVHEEPRPVETEAELPTGIAPLLEQLLQKDPDERWADAAALAEALRTQTGPGPAPLPMPAARRRRQPLPATWIAAAALVAAVAVAGAWLVAGRGGEPPEAAVHVVPFTSDRGLKAWPRLSPDGERVAYSWYRGPRPNLYVKALGVGASPLRLTEHHADSSPAWSPDGKEIAFIRQGWRSAAIYIVSSLGGHPRKIVDLGGPPHNAPLSPALSWSRDGQWLVFATGSRADEPSRIERLSLEGLTREPLTEPPPGSAGDLYPVLSPDQQHVAFARSLAGSWGSMDVWVQGLDGGEARRLTFEQYDDTGSLAWTPDSREIVFSSNAHGGGTIHRVGLRGGEPRPIAGVGRGTAFPTIRGERLVYRQSTGEESAIMRLPAAARPADERVPVGVIYSSEADLAPSYSPDGRRVAFVSRRAGPQNIWTAREDGSDPAQLTSFSKHTGTPRWSPDGKWIAFDSNETGNWDVYVVDAEGGVPRRVTVSLAEDGTPSWSRDGRWIYFHSNRSGSQQIWKIPAMGGEARQVTRGGGFYAEESWDGKSLFFAEAHEGGGIRRMPVEGGDEESVIEGPVLWLDWTVSRTGIYFQTIEPAEPEPEVSLAPGPPRWIRIIHRYDLASGRTTPWYRYEGPGILQWLSVSPDEQWMLFTSQSVAEAELMLAENFR